jgi:hypothetical protein
MKKIFLVLTLFFAVPVFAAESSSGVITISPAEIVKKIESSSRPFTLMVFTSWCPYCKKQVADLAALTPAQQLQIPEVLAVSTDANPVAYANYLRDKSGVFFPMRLYAGAQSMESLLKNYGSTFDGGIPYFAIIKDKKIIREFWGYTEPMKLKLAD